MTLTTRTVTRMASVAGMSLLVAALAPAAPAGPDFAGSDAMHLSSGGGSIESPEAEWHPLAINATEGHDSYRSTATFGDRGNEEVTNTEHAQPIAKWYSPYFGCWWNCWDFWFDCPCYVHYP